MDAGDFLGERSGEKLATPFRIPVGVGDVEVELQETCHQVRFGTSLKRLFKTGVEVVVVRVKGMDEGVYLVIMIQPDRAIEGTADPE